MKIEKLTKEQTGKFPYYVKKWTDIGLSTEPADRPRAEAAIKWMYAQAKLSEPEIIWTRSPFENYLKFNKLVDNTDQTFDPWSSIFGCHDANWLGFYDFFREECGLVKETDPLHGLFELSKSCGWCLPCEHMCFMSDRPLKINKDAAGRLHSTTEAALEYRDGWKLYQIHGVTVPDFFITDPKKITIDLIDKENNVEVKRIMIGLYKSGIQDYIFDSGATLIDEKKDIHSGLPIKLWKKTRTNDTDIVMVEMLNTTKELNDAGQYIHKPYYIRVKPDITNALEAVAWHHNQSLEEYLETEVGT